MENIIHARACRTFLRIFFEKVLYCVPTAMRALKKRFVWHHLMTIVVFSALAACGGKDDDVAAPKNLTYTQPPAQLIGEPIGQIKPTVEGSVDSYSVAPALPDGLAIDAKTGIISGVPQAEVAAKPYLVTAANKGGATTFTLLLTLSEEEHTEATSAGSLEFISADPSTLLNVQDALRFEVTGTQLPATKEGIRVFNNDKEIAGTAIEVQGNFITVAAALLDGRNDIVVLASDTSQSALSFKTTLWAGSNTLNVSVLNPDGTSAESAKVVARILDNQGLTLQKTAVNGQIEFQNVPNRTILLSATAENNNAASLTTIGDAGSVQIRLQGFAVPSSVSNNDFSQGTAGWQPSNNGALSIIPHVEDITPVPQPKAVSAQNASTAGQVDRRQFALEDRRPRINASRPGASKTVAQQTLPANPDLAITTFGEGPSSVSRTFTVPAGTSAVKIRYRFITIEVPGGYFGSQYNDSFSIMMRSQAGGATASDANSMNSLGLAAFDANGSTAWRMLTLPVAKQGDTIQIDLTVTNVSDGYLDSQLVVDSVEVDNLTITSDVATACVNQTVTFQATGASADSVSWTGGQSPATGTGSSFPTRFTTPGDQQVTASADGASAQRTVHIKESSGAAWVQRFPTSTSLTDLDGGFRANATSFVGALRAAGASVEISATYRPKERAYLMHYAYEIAKNGFNPANVPEQEGIEICWEHRTAEGNVDLQASKAAAQAMVNGYGMAHPAALVSRHTQRLAVDMTISWSGDLTINGADGTPVTIATAPRTGAGNSSLHSVGAGYHVYKLASDPPHWSDDGH